MAGKLSMFINDLDNIEFYRGVCEDFKLDIAKVLMKLPKDVYDYIKYNCVFYSIGIHHGITWEPMQENKWAIILSEKMPKKDRNKIIAHEIAHAYLKHKTISAGDDNEREACNLAQKWGYDLKYIDV